MVFFGQRVNCPLFEPSPYLCLWLGGRQKREQKESFLVIKKGGNALGKAIVLLTLSLISFFIVIAGSSNVSYASIYNSAGPVEQGGWTYVWSKTFNDIAYTHSDWAIEMGSQVQWGIGDNWAGGHYNTDAMGWVGWRTWNNTCPLTGRSSTSMARPFNDELVLESRNIDLTQIPVNTQLQFGINRASGASWDVEFSNNGGGSWTSFRSQGGSGNNTISIPENYRESNFRVRFTLRNGSGTNYVHIYRIWIRGEEQNEVPPSQPGSISISSPRYVGQNVTVNWGSVNWGTGSNRNYRLQVSRNGGSWSHVANTGTTRNRTYSIPLNTTSLRFRVRAETSDGTSNWRYSSTVSVTKQNQSAPGSVTLWGMTHGEDRSVSWSSVGTASNGYDVQVYRNGSRIINTTSSNTSYTINSSNFSAGDSIYVRVGARATSTHHASGWRNSTTRTVQRASQSDPNNVSLETPTYGQSAQLTWDRVDTASSGYRIRIRRDGGSWEDYSVVSQSNSPSLTIQAGEFDDMGTRQFAVAARMTDTHQISGDSLSEERTIQKAEQAELTINPSEDSSHESGVERTYVVSGGSGTGGITDVLDSGNAITDSALTYTANATSGTYTISVTKAGDDNYNPRTQEFTFNMVAQAPPEIEGLVFETPTYGEDEILSWDKVTGASDGYEVQIRRDGAGWEEYDLAVAQPDGAKVSITIPSSEFEDMGTRQFRVRSKEVGAFAEGDYAQTDIRTVQRAEQDAPESITLSALYYGESAELTWDKVDTANDGYEIQVQKDEGDWVMFTTVSQVTTTSIAIDAKEFDDIEDINFGVGARQTLTHNDSDWTSTGAINIGKLEHDIAENIEFYNDFDLLFWSRMPMADEGYEVQYRLDGGDWERLREMVPQAIRRDVEITTSAIELNDEESIRFRVRALETDLRKESDDTWGYSDEVFLSNLEISHVNISTSGGLNLGDSIDFNVEFSRNVYVNSPLDTVNEDAAVAYGLRKLKSTYQGPLVEVRVDTDKYDFYPDEDGALSRNSLNDQGTSLGDFITDNDAFITKWYDQSGNGKHAKQTRDLKQPKIASGGAIFKQDGKPTIYFDGDSNYLENKDFENSINENTLTSFIVASTFEDASNDGRFASLHKSGHDSDNLSTNSALLFAYGANGGEFGTFLGAGNNILNNQNNNQSFVASVRHDSDNIRSLYVDGAFKGRIDGVREFKPDEIYIGRGVNEEGNYNAKVNISEFILYNSALSDEEKTGVTRNQGNLYGIDKGLEDAPIDLVTGASIAYGLRRLSDEYEGSALRVRGHRLDREGELSGGSKVVRGIDTSSLKTGMYVIGEGIEEGTTIASIYHGLDRIELSKNTTTVNGSRTLSFEIDIGFDKDGNLDIQSLMEFVGTEDGTVHRWYDQSGNGEDLNLDDLVKPPVLVSNGILNSSNGKPVLISDIQGGLITQSAIDLSDEGQVVIRTQNSVVTSIDDESLADANISEIVAYQNLSDAEKNTIKENQNSYYGFGEMIEVYPRIELDFGGFTRYATYTEGSGTNTVTFRYIANKGENTIGNTRVTIKPEIIGGVIMDLSGSEVVERRFRQE